MDGLVILASSESLHGGVLRNRSDGQWVTVRNIYVILYSDVCTLTCEGTGTSMTA